MPPPSVPLIGEDQIEYVAKSCPNHGAAPPPIRGRLGGGTRTNKKAGSEPAFRILFPPNQPWIGAIWISTRRFWARPASVAFEAIGDVSPLPSI